MAAGAARDVNLFEFTCLLSSSDIRLSAWNEVGSKQLLALVTGSGGIVLRYAPGGQQAAVVKMVPWFVDPDKKITALCFYPSGTWLLLAGRDGSLFLLPVLPLLEPGSPAGPRGWSSSDVTCFSTTCPHPATPSALAWWQQRDGEGGEVAVVGTDRGDVTMYSLGDGGDVQLLGTTAVRQAVVELAVCRDDVSDCVFLLITNEYRVQWKLLLEQQSTGYLWPMGVAGRKNGAEQGLSGGLGLTVEPDPPLRASHLPTARSRLQGLKQLSVEKLASLRQRLAETRSKGGVSLPLTSVAPSRRESSSSDDGSLPSRGDSNSRPAPEKLAALVGDTYLRPQYARGQPLLSGYYQPSSILTVHDLGLSVVPLSVHKLPAQCLHVLLTDRFLYVTDGTSVSVVSSQLSESRLDMDCDHNPESVVQSFTLSTPGERIMALYRASTARENDTCVVVTSRGAYWLSLARSPQEAFLTLVLERQELERAERLALAFGLDMSRLLEKAGDVKLAAREFVQAVALYKLSRCRHLKTVLKFAAGGHCSELLGLVSMLLGTSSSDMAVSERVHLSNLALMGHSEQVLRAPYGKAKLLATFLQFLKENSTYDEVLAVNVAAQTGLYEVLCHLGTQRGLWAEVLEVLARSCLEREQGSLEAPLWQCLTERGLLGAMVARPTLTAAHLAFCAAAAPQLGLETLQRLAALYDPSAPELRPAVGQHRRMQQSAVSLLDSAEADAVEPQLPIQNLIQNFILVLLYIAAKTTASRCYCPELIGRVEAVPAREEEEGLDDDDCGATLPVRENKLSCGFAHVAVVRNGDVFTWGSAAGGCLGTGPTLSRSSQPSPVALFPSLRVSVWSVASGRQHTLALTSNGLYAWGSSQFGQLGLGAVGRCPRPALVDGLSGKTVVAIAAGQYHSLALTRDGRVFSWGWGVHGQLGLGSVEDQRTPRLIRALNTQVVVQVAAGHAHSLALTAEGDVLAFGSSVFGQLGSGNNIKSSVPVPVAGITERVVMVASGYFHNLALTITNKLYTWGSSPQVLRLQAQAQKKARVMQQRQSGMDLEGVDRVSGGGSVAELPSVVMSPSVEFKGLTQQVSRTAFNNGTKPHEPAKNDLGSDDGQSHLSPQLVDTSAVVGPITQLSCGCHHSALLTKGGTVCVWGRNIDGQLGNGSRKEQLQPTPLGTPSGLLGAAKSPGMRSSIVIPPTASDRPLRAEVVSCGCDFTVAVESGGGRVWAWGSNSQGQLGRPPMDDPRGLDGKLVMVKSARRVIRLPHSEHNASDVPREVSGVPTETFSFKCNDDMVTQDPCPPLGSLEDPSYGSRTLHFALQQLHGLYNGEALLSKCIELENYQAAAKLATLERNYHTALAYQLKALVTATSHTSRNTNNVQSSKSEGCEWRCSSAASQADRLRAFKLDLITEASNDHDDTNHHFSLDRSDSKSNLVSNRQSENGTHNVNGSCVEENNSSCWRSSNGNSPDEKTDRSDTPILDKKLDDILRPGAEESVCTNGDQSLCERSEKNDEDVTLELEVLNNDRNTRKSTRSLQGSQAPSEDTPSGLTTPDSIMSTPRHEIHAFAVQGGAEMMSEDQRMLASPVSSMSSPEKRPPTAPRPAEGVAEEAERVVEHYVAAMQEDSGAMMSQLLQEGIQFWMDQQLPVDHLENLLMKHMSQLFYPLGLLLFCKQSTEDESTPDSRAAEMLSGLSSRFCLQLCSTLLCHVTDKEKSSPEYIQHLAQATNVPAVGPNGCSAESPEQLLELVMESLGSRAPAQQQLVVRGEELTGPTPMVFSCGHHLTSPPALDDQLDIPHTAETLRSAYRSTPPVGAACPRCVLQMVRERASLG